MQIKWSRYIPHKPHAKQAAFLWLMGREAFYGGAAGGGKSDALLMGALQYVDTPGYAALILRRTYADLALPGAIMDRSHQWLDQTDAHWDDEKKTWRFPSGATITFGYLQYENDKTRYRSAEFQYIAFDELTQFTETQYRYLFSRLRRLKGVKIPIRMRSASNPGDIGHEWVKRRLIIEARQNMRVFIPARLEDNPSLDQYEYELSLNELDAVTRAQLRNGNWDVRADGNKFKRGWFKVISRDQVPADLKLCRMWDLAATEPKPGKSPDWTAGALFGEGEGRYYILDMQHVQDTPLAVQKLIAQTALDDEARYGRNRVVIYMEQEPGSSGVNTIDTYTREVLMGYDFHGIRSTGSKEERANPFSAAAEAGNVFIVQGRWNTDYLDELTAFPTVAVHDDQVDASSGAFARLRRIPVGVAPVGMEQVSIWNTAANIASGDDDEYDSDGDDRRSIRRGGDPW